MIYHRKIFDLLTNQSKEPDIIVITGMRQVGKTTTLNKLYENVKSSNKIRLDFTNIIDRRIFQSQDYNQIWNNLASFNITNNEKAYIYIDELQEFPESVKAIKYLYDHYKVKFILTGSSSFYLKNLFPESLWGRKIIFELFP